MHDNEKLNHYESAANENVTNYYKSELSRRVAHLEAAQQDILKDFKIVNSILMWMSLAVFSVTSVMIGMICKYFGIF